MARALYKSEPSQICLASLLNWSAQSQNLIHQKSGKIQRFLLNHSIASARFCRSLMRLFKGRHCMFMNDYGVCEQPTKILAKS